MVKSDGKKISAAMRTHLEGDHRTIAAESLEKLFSEEAQENIRKR